VNVNDPADDAKRAYLEPYGDALVTNNYLRLTALALSVVLIGGMATIFAVLSWAKNQKPLVVRIDDIGRATAVNYTGFAYAPAAPELRYFLAQFVQLYNARIVGSAEERFSRSLYYLAAPLAQAAIEDERKTGTLAQFANDGSDEIDVDVKNIVLQDLRAKPMKASVDFDKVHYPRGERRENKRERYSGYFEFVIQEHVPNSFVLVNPLGITITYFRMDAAFK
jgi:type IV secretion system protein VirB5